jgi:hypothetical protein
MCTKFPAYLILLDLIILIIPGEGSFFSNTRLNFFSIKYSCRSMLPVFGQSLIRMKPGCTDFQQERK